MTNTKFQHKAPFHTTHRRRKDGMEAMLLAIRDGVALYRVKFMHGGRIQDSTTSRDAALFAADFEVVA